MKPRRHVCDCGRCHTCMQRDYARRRRLNGDRPFGEHPGPKQSCFCGHCKQCRACESMRALRKQQANTHPETFKAWSEKRRREWSHSK